jgi:magnesium-transporting ATPase (P-type)
VTTLGALFMTLENTHSLEVKELSEHLRVDLEKGLISSEAKKRLDQYGGNKLTLSSRRSPFLRYLDQFKNLLILILIAAAFIAALLGEWVDGIVIIAVVIIITLIGFIQEGKAEKAIESITQMLSQRAWVFRDGEKVSISAEQLVPGDVVFLQSGDKVPADLRLIQIKELQVDEAILTGESMPVEKKIEAVAADAQLAERYSMVYSGTFITKGNARGIVINVGNETEIGKISSMVSEVESLKTPLMRQMDEFGQHLSIAIVVIAFITFVIGYFIRDLPAVDTLMAAVSLMVAAIPEGLPAIMTITLAIGVQKMAGQHAIIRKLPAVETLGSVNVICSDKTGTLTRNEMTVRKLVTASQKLEVSGMGYGADGNFHLDDKEIDPQNHSTLLKLIRAGLLCNDSSLEKTNEEWIVQGDPTEGALLSLGMKAGMDLQEESKKFARKDVIPFESEFKLMATLNHSSNQDSIIFVKGAPEKVRDICSFEEIDEKNTPIRKEYWQEQVHRLASSGHRALFFAAKTVAKEKNKIDHSDISADMVLLGMVGMIDPPREEAIAAVSECHSAGIDVKMITGDHVLTAQSIGAQIGIGKDKKAITGKQVEEADEEELTEIVINADVFARTSPAQKVKLVKALQTDGKIVAMTGDGVNDAPSLKQADIGVAMGQRGTDAAKEASEMILTDDNFASIDQAVRQGRAVYDNLKKAIFFMLPTNGGQAFTIFVALVLGTTLPLIPLQVLWVNMITTGTLAIALAFEPPEEDIMKRSPRKNNDRIFSRFLLWRIAFVSILLVIGTFGSFYVSLFYADVSIESARTIAINTLVMGQVFYLFNTRFLLNSSLSFSGVLGGRAIKWSLAGIVILQSLFTYFGPIQRVFGTSTFPAHIWVGIFAFGIVFFFLVELEKRWLKN